MEMIQEIRHPSSQQISTSEAESLFSLLNKIWVYEPSQRISAEELMRQSWFTSKFDQNCQRKISEEEGRSTIGNGIVSVKSQLLLVEATDI